MAVVPFNRELNRFVLRLAHPRAEQYRVTWGEQSRVYPASANRWSRPSAASFGRCRTPSTSNPSEHDRRN
jgi:hypothetical protein